MGVQQWQQQLMYESYFDLTIEILALASTRSPNILIGVLFAKLHMLDLRFEI